MQSLMPIEKIWEPSDFLQDFQGKYFYEQVEKSREALSQLTFVKTFGFSPKTFSGVPSKEKTQPYLAGFSF
ncbi:hypothetical protein [Robiginitalea aurantiaca]|uniref:hypothetical protein n=1 Tax=Robiginitalea aurantiaca TaxID=3056915 RepID=UPI00336C1990